MNRRVFLSALLVASVASVASVAHAEDREKVEGDKLDQLLADLAKARKNLKTMKSSFTQERAMKLLATSIKSTGQFYYVAPDRLRWELGSPDDVTYWVGPDGLAYKTKTSSGSMATAQGNVAKSLGDLRALLAGDVTPLKARYDLTATRSSTDVILDGVSKDPKATGIKSFSMTMDAGLVKPIKAKLVEGKNDSIDITFSNVEVDKPIDPALMKP